MNRYYAKDRVELDGRCGTVVDSLNPNWPGLPVLVYVIWDGTQGVTAHDAGVLAFES